MFDELDEIYEEALRGREYWIKLRDKYQIGKEDALIICPSRSDELYYSALKWLPEYMEKKYVNRAVVIREEEKQRIEQQCICKGEIIFETLEEKRIYEILKYYRLIQFTKNIVIVSMDVPFGNSHFIGKKGIEVDDYVRNAIYV